MDDIPVVTEEELARERAEAAAELAQELKKEALESIKVQVNSIPYDGGLVAQSNMGDVGTIANWMFNKKLVETLELVSQSPDATAELKYLSTILTQVYQGVYKDTQVNWKGADNQIHSVQGESVLEALYAVMQTKSSIIEEK